MSAVKRFKYSLSFRSLSLFRFALRLEQRLSVPSTACSFCVPFSPYTHARQAQMGRKHCNHLRCTSRLAHNRGAWLLRRNIYLSGTFGMHIKCVLVLSIEHILCGIELTNWESIQKYFEIFVEILRVLCGKGLIRVRTKSIELNIQNEHSQWLPLDTYSLSVCMVWLIGNSAICSNSMEIFVKLADQSWQCFSTQWPEPQLQKCSGEVEVSWKRFTTFRRNGSRCIKNWYTVYEYVSTKSMNAHLKLPNLVNWSTSNIRLLLCTRLTLFTS